jgi:osmotically-inducible protein OsmY
MAGTRRAAKLLISGSLVVASFAIGCGSSAYTRRTDEDRRLSARVDERLAASPALSTARVAAKSHRGVVVLLGEVPDENLRSDAGHVASAVPGVVRVNNLILVARDATTAEGSAPAAGALTIARTD